MPATRSLDDALGNARLAIAEIDEARSIVLATPVDCSEEQEKANNDRLEVAEFGCELALRQLAYWAGKR